MVVITTGHIERGTVFGPIPKTTTLSDPVVLIGYRTCDMLPDIHTVKIDLTKHGQGQALAEWVPYVQSARNSEEQNLEAYIDREKLFYVACRYIPASSEVFVWYEERYARVLGVPPLDSDCIKNNLYNCPRCNSTFVYPYCLRAHMKFKCKQQPHPQQSQQQQRSNDAVPYKDFRNNSQPSNTSSFQISPRFDPFDFSQLEVCKTTSKRKLTEQENHESLHDIKKLCDHPSKSQTEWTRDDTVSAFQKIETTTDSASDTIQSTPPVLSTSPTDASHDFRTGSPPSRPKLLSEDQVAIMQQQALLFFQNFQPQLRNPLSSLEMVNFLNNSSAFTIINSPTIFVNQPTNNNVINSVNLLSKYQNHLIPHFPTDVNLPAPEHQNLPLIQPRKLPHPLLEPQLSPALPSTFAALNLTQNWCAKCNTSFRMTSDLVYHMRSHHKRDFDPVKKRKDDKLKCEVCGESFRERHHLTRHMTSHV